jgi:hypothetical protein
MRRGKTDEHLLRRLARDQVHLVYRNWIQMTPFSNLDVALDHRRDGLADLLRVGLEIAQPVQSHQFADHGRGDGDPNADDAVTLPLPTASHVASLAGGLR